MRVGIVTRMRQHLERGENGGTFVRRRHVVEVDAAGVDWVCVAVRPGREFMVADDLAEVGFRVFCPHGVRVSWRARDRGSPVEKRIYAERDYPVFGAYVFVGQPAGFVVVKRSHPHILGVLDEGRSFAPKRFIRAAADLWAQGAWDARTKIGTKFRRGDVVRFREGPFVGLSAIVEDLPREMRAVVSLGLFGGKTPTAVDTTILELI